MTQVFNFSDFVNRVSSAMTRKKSGQPRRRRRFAGYDCEALESRALLSAAAVSHLVATPVTPESATTGKSLLLQVSDNNNTFATAIIAGTFPVGSSKTFTGSVDFVNDGSDYYKVVLPSTVRLRVNLSGLSSDADVQLLNSSSQSLALSANSGTSIDQFALGVNAGTYYIRVFKPVSGSTNYSLNIAAFSITDDTLGTAFDFGSTAVSSSNSWNDSVNSTNDVNDYFKFELSRNNHVVINLNGLSSDADLALLNSSGGTISSSTHAGTLAESTDNVLAAGTYYIKVSKFSTGAANYHLAIGIGDDSFSTATGFGTNATSKTFNSDISSGDAVDYYSFTITDRRGISIALTNLTADADVEIYTSAGVKVGRSAKGGTTSESIKLNLNAGTYYVKVIAYSSSFTNYTIINSATSGLWSTEIGRTT